MCILWTTTFEGRELVSVPDESNANAGTLFPEL